MRDQLETAHVAFFAHFRDRLDWLAAETHALSHAVSRPPPSTDLRSKMADELAMINVEGEPLRQVEERPLLSSSFPDFETATCL